MKVEIDFMLLAGLPVLSTGLSLNTEICVNAQMQVKNRKDNLGSKIIIVLER